jgi:hypothetical protein
MLAWAFQAFNPKFLLNWTTIINVLIGVDVAARKSKYTLPLYTKHLNAAQIATAFEYEQTVINAFVEYPTACYVDNLEKKLPA